LIDGIGKLVMVVYPTACTARENEPWFVTIGLTPSFVPPVTAQSLACSKPRIRGISS